MDTYVTHCTKRATCASKCGKPILLSDPMVICRVWTGTNGKPRIHYQYYKHFECWISDARMYLELHPYRDTGSKRGTKPMALSPEDAALRHKLLTHKASLEQRIQKLNTTLPGYYERVEKLYNQIFGLYARIASVGGIPASWLAEFAVVTPEPNAEPSEATEELVNE
jgi:hypothetical protein